MERNLIAHQCHVRDYFAAGLGSGMDIPEMIRHSLPVRSQVWVMRIVEGGPFPSLSSQVSVIQ